VNQSKSTLTPTVRCVGIILPFLLWLYFHQWGMVPPFVDSLWYSTGITYHFHYIAQGIFPLWDPFRVWGWPDATDPRSFGEFNPFYLIIVLLTMLNIPSLIAFNILLVMFYWLGCMGLYLLVLRLWKKEILALTAYVMLMFSLLGELLFSQLAAPLLLFSTIWFFYFLVRFIQAKNSIEQRRSFFGVIFVLMIIVVTYLPFFFLITFAAVVLATGVVRPSLIVNFICQCAYFVKSCPIRAGVGLLAGMLALIPGVLWYLSSKSGDTLLVTARNGFNASDGSANVSLGLINHSGLMAQLSVGELFADQDFVFNCFTYFPIFLFIILMMGMLARMDTRRWIVLIAGFLVLLCSLANVTVVHNFLYEHLSFFHLFRNLYFFGPFLFCFLIIIAMGQLKWFLAIKPQHHRGKYWRVFYVVVVHMIIGAILFYQ
jgi:hypothetical protein